MKQAKTSTESVDQHQLDEIAGMTPFPSEQLQGQHFSRGNMLGGTVPVQEAADAAPWISQK